jgi:hypothetical protein
MKLSDFLLLNKKKVLFLFGFKQKNPYVEEKPNFFMPTRGEKLVCVFA